jgi:signal transduction histidine kinase
MFSSVKTNPKRRLALLFSVPLAFSLLFFLVNQIAETTDTNLIQIQTLSSSLGMVLSLSNDVEGGERGFLLTGDEEYLRPLQRAAAWLPGQLRLCRTYAEDTPEVQAEVDAVIAMGQRHLTAVENVLGAQRESGFSTAIQMMKSGGSEQMMRQLRRKVTALQSRLNKEASAILERQRILNRTAFLFFLLGTSLMAIVLVRLYMDVVSYMESRDAAQEALQTLNMELESRIAEGTRELRQSNQELEQFAYVASHDLQEPLRTIISFTQLLSKRYRGRLDSDADEFIDYIVSASRRMSELINGLLTLARLRKSGRSTAPTSFEELLREAESSLQAAIRENNARVEHGPLPALAVDHLQFRQLLQNLISNAIRYRRDEPPLIRVNARREGSSWIFSVADNSQGFEQRYAERIFGLFQRLQGRDVNGTGLGLSISRKIVERHGGKIWAESKPGSGSTFHFSLPTTLEVNLPAQTPADP